MSDFILSLDVDTPGSLTARNRTVGLSQRNKIIEQLELANIRDNALLNTFYTREDLLDLLDQPDSQGIRIYPAFDSNGGFSTLAVATDSRRNDIVKGDASKCLVSNGFFPASRLTEEQGIEVVERYNAHLLEEDGDQPLAFSAHSSRSALLSNYSKVFFISEDILGLMDSDSIGIRFYTTKIKFNNSGKKTFPTLTAVAVNNREEDGSTALLSALPCPPNCGGGYVGGDTTSDA